MGKVNLLVKYCLKNLENEYNIKGIFYDNQIKFLEKDNKMILNLTESSLKRITLNEEIFFNFNEKTCLIKDKKSNNQISFPIEVISLKKSNNYFYVKYKIEDVFEILIKII